MNEKIANDIMLEAKCAKLLMCKIREGEVPVRKSSEQVIQYLNNIMDCLAFREDKK